MCNELMIADFKIMEEKMEEKYILSVEGKQTVDGQSDKIDLQTRASYMMKNGNRYISYTEYDTMNPKQTYRTTIKVSPENIVTVMKGGTEKHNLMLEQGVRHKCEYITGFGMISLGVFTDSVKVNLDDKGGEIKVHYNIDVQSELASVNELTINIKEAVNDVGSYSDIEQS